MSEWQCVTWSDVKVGDHIRLTRTRYGVREGKLTEYREAENGEWVWNDENGNPLLDPWWASGSIVQKRKDVA